MVNSKCPARHVGRIFLSPCHLPGQRRREELRRVFRRHPDQNCRQQPEPDRSGNAQLGLYRRLQREHGNGLQPCAALLPDFGNGRPAGSDHGQPDQRRAEHHRAERGMVQAHQPREMRPASSLRFMASPTLGSKTLPPLPTPFTNGTDRSTRWWQLVLPATITRDRRAR